MSGSAQGWLRGEGEERGTYDAVCLLQKAIDRIEGDWLPRCRHLVLPEQLVEPDGDVHGVQ